MKTILVPTDFSACARNALKYAVGMAKDFKMEIALLHVYSINIIDPHMPADYIDQMASDKDKAASEALEKEISKLYEEIPEAKQQIKITMHKEMGFITDNVMDISEALNVEFIVMGTTGAGGLKKILGSNTYNLIAKTKFPVLAIPGTAAYRKWSEIVYATDFNQREYQYIKFLIEATAFFNSKILCLHVNPEDEEEHKKQIADLQEYFWDEFKNGKIRIKFIKNGDAAEAIESFVKNENPDLLVMLTQKRNWLERLFHKSVVKELSSNSVVPVLALHEL